MRVVEKARARRAQTMLAWAVAQRRREIGRPGPCRSRCRPLFPLSVARIEPGLENRSNGSSTEWSKQSKPAAPNARAADLARGDFVLTEDTTRCASLVRRSAHNNLGGKAVRASKKRRRHYVGCARAVKICPLGGTIPTQGQSSNSACKTTQKLDERQLLSRHAHWQRDGLNQPGQTHAKKTGRRQRPDSSGNHARRHGSQSRHGRRRKYITAIPTWSQLQLSDDGVSAFVDINID